jgi:micrococcal nuclease
MSPRSQLLSIKTLAAVIFLILAAFLFTPDELDQLLSDGVDQVADVDQATELVNGAVSRVVDGDTVDVVVEGEIVRVRLIGIDTPETVDPRKPVQCFGAEASQHLRDLLANQIVTLERDVSQGEVDKYDRELAYLILPDGSNVAELMLRDGFAYEYTYDSAYKYQEVFKNAEQDARDNESGLWSRETCGGNR